MLSTSYRQLSTIDRKLFFGFLVHSNSLQELDLRAVSVSVLIVNEERSRYNHYAFTSLIFQNMHFSFHFQTLTKVIASFIFIYFLKLV